MWWTGKCHGSTTKKWAPSFWLFSFGSHLPQVIFLSSFSWLSRECHGGYMFGFALLQKVRKMWELSGSRLQVRETRISNFLGHFFSQIIFKLTLHFNPGFFARGKVYFFASVTTKFLADPFRIIKIIFSARDRQLT